VTDTPDPTRTDQVDTDQARTDQARTARRARHAAILAEVATEETEAAETEIATTNTALVVPLHLRIDRDRDRDLDTALRARARARADTEHIPTSALVRRLLRHAVHDTGERSLTAAAAEDIARRVTREQVSTRATAGPADTPGRSPETRRRHGWSVNPASTAANRNA